MINNDKMKLMETEQYYSLEEVANELKVAYLTVYRWVQAGKLKAHQIEKQYRVSKVDFDAFVDARKSTTTPKLQELSKDELINMVRQLKRQKKFGLVWENKPENVAEQCKNELPVLEAVESKDITDGENGSTNLIIEGDNYHSLSVLNYTHPAKIDVIYIDPPYNTGNKSWRYNNHYIEREDPYKHSKWLSFMQKRLLLARNLLTEDGVIIVTIDDYELFPLGVLLDEIFGEQNRLAVVSVVNKKSGRTTDKFFATSNEYYLFYARDIEKAQVNLFQVSEASIAEYKLLDETSPYKWRDFLRTGGYSTPEERPNSYYPIYYNEQKEVISVLPVKDAVEIYPIDSQGKKRVWRQTRPSLTVLIQNGDIKVGKNRQGKYSVRIKDRVKEGVKPKTVWDDPRYDAATHGTKLLEKLLNATRAFDFPKSVYAVSDSIKILTSHKQEATILDFFAGSGTTGHAVMLLNKEDEGQRRFILCTNNENGIAEEVCYQRIKKVIDGVDGLPEVTGIPANLRYFKTAFVSKSKVSDDTRRELVRKSTEMICVRENTFEKVVDKKDFKIYSDSSHVTGVLFNLDAITDFKKKLQEQKKPANIYVFSLTNDTYDEDFEDLGLDHKLCPIPESILEVYRKLFRSKK